MKTSKNTSRIFIVLGLLFLLSCKNQKPQEQQTQVQPNTDPVIERIEFIDSCGNHRYQGLLVDGKKEGLWITYNDSTCQVQEIQNFVNGIKDGIYVLLKNDKTLDGLGNYENGQREGHWINFRNNNLLKREAFFIDDYSATIGKQYDDNGFLFEEYDYKTNQVIRKYEITKLDKYKGWTTK